MLNLISASDKIYISNSDAGSVKVHSSWIDWDGTATPPVPGRTNTADITTATNTDVVAAPASGITRNVKTLSINNAHASIANTVTVYHTDGTHAEPLVAGVLAPGQTLTFSDANGWRKTTSAGSTDQTGTDGNTILYGSGSPASGTGVNGNFYIDTTAHKFYGPKTAGAWDAGIYLIGAVLPRTVTIADTGTAPVNGDTTDTYIITALAQALTFAAPSGTPSEEQVLMYRIKDNGTARALAFNAIFAARGVALPTVTILGKYMRLAFLYNATAAKWDLVAVVQEA